MINGSRADPGVPKHTDPLDPDPQHGFLACLGVVYNDGTVPGTYQTTQIYGRVVKLVAHPLSTAAHVRIQTSINYHKRAT